MTGSSVSPAPADMPAAPALRLDALESFLVVGREGNISRAAALLFLTQSGVRQRVRSLEKALACKLIVTTTRAVELTNEGRVLLKHGLELLATTQRLQVDLRMREETPLAMVPLSRH